MKKTDMETIVESLKKSPLYNLSMANKELFHSNFLAWFGNTYRDLFKRLIEQLHGCWPTDIQDFSILREYNHFDICVISNDNPRILIENKVKSVPTIEQLDRYREDVKNDSCIYILLTMTTNLQNMKKAKGWEIITYKELSTKLSNFKLADPYHLQLLKDYCKYVGNLQQIIEAFDSEDYYFSNKKDNKNKKDLGIHDICGKRKAQALYQKLLKECQEHDLSVVSEYKDLSDKNILVGWGYTDLPLLEVRFKTQNDSVIIQIQGKQYRHAVEFYDDRIEDRITKDKNKKGYIPSQKGLDYLQTNYSDILSLTNDKIPRNYPFENITTFGQNKNPGYCKYCNGMGNKNYNNLISCFVYQWIEIPGETTCDELVERIIQDTINLIKIIKRKA